MQTRQILVNNHIHRWLTQKFLEDKEFDIFSIEQACRRDLELPEGIDVFSAPAFNIPIKHQGWFTFTLKISNLKYFIDSSFKGGP